MKKIIGLSIAVVLIIGLVAGGTFAYFSDTETTTGNTFTAGIIDLELSQTGTIVTTEGDLTDLKPCQTGYLVITLTATEVSNPMYVWKHIKDVTSYENGITDAEQDWYDAHPDQLVEGAKNDIDRYIHFDMWIEVDEVEGYSAAGGDIMLIDEADGWLLSDNLDDYSSLVPAVVDPYDNGVECYWIYLGELQPGESMTIVQSFHMDAYVDNWAQSDSLMFTEEFFALQTVGNPTTDELPSDEFPGTPGPLPAP